MNFFQFLIFSFVSVFLFFRKSQHLRVPLKSYFLENLRVIFNSISKKSPFLCFFIICDVWIIVFWVTWRRSFAFGSHVWLPFRNTMSNMDTVDDNSRISKVSIYINVNGIWVIPNMIPIIWVIFYESFELYLRISRNFMTWPIGTFWPEDKFATLCFVLSVSVNISNKLNLSNFLFPSHVWKCQRHLEPNWK